MKHYLLSLGAGLLVGVIYSLLNVRSPAPPAIALLGLAGMLMGEQAIPIAKHLVTKATVISYLTTPECTGQGLGPQAVDPQKPEGQA